jgi:hypothetical protein
MPPPPSAGPAIGSLCSGYGGLELAVQEVLGGTVAWHAETDPGACRILARHWPHVPNLGDITTVGWSTVPRVCVLTAGFPCQRRLRRGPPRRTRPRYPLGPVAARRPCGRSPPSLPGGDRECPRTPHLPRPPRWRRGTLPVVCGRRPSPASCAGTRRRTRLPGRPPVRRTMARATCLRHRSTPPPRAGLPRRLAHRRPCSKPRRPTSGRTAAPSTRRSGPAAATARTSPTRWNGCSPPGKRRTVRRAHGISGTGTAT